MKYRRFPVLPILASLLSTTATSASAVAADAVVAPRVVSAPVRHDSDDPAIWVDPADPARTLVVGTDKDIDGALYVFGLDGRVREDLVVRGLLRPNNVDIARGVMLGGRAVDLVIVAERFAHRLRIYALPDLRPVDGGGIPVFEGERARDAMGVASWVRPVDGALLVTVSRSDRYAPQRGYLHQYRLVDDGSGRLRGLLVRAFGTWSGRKEIEALSVDPVGGSLFASDETFGLRKYRVDPAAEDADDEVAVFGTTGFARDHEGSAVMRDAAGRSWLWVSDQQAGTLRVFDLSGSPGKADEPRFIGHVPIAARETDGIDLVTGDLPGFPGGLLVAMSDDRTFHFYAIDDLLKVLVPAAAPVRR
ncbi:MAG: phytase [Gammaproteobacteria bacterium]|nr:phytase [Gammaproteobacteria bacterium]